MALSTEELARIKAALGYNVLAIGALPYVGFSQLFDQVVLPYLPTDTATTSATTVTAATSATPVSLTLASVTGVAAGARVIVDVDSLREVATVRSVSGSTISVALTLAHSGTYPVTVWGAEATVRDKLRKVTEIDDKFDSAAKTAGLKRAEDLEWYPNAVFTGLSKQRMDARDELGAAIGIENRWRTRQGSGQSIAMY